MNNATAQNKNIIICSDGTGNRGGIGPETNVYRIYSAIDIHNDDHPQIKYYDDGVGTGGNKFIRLVTGAFGLGLDRNIIQAYTFLCRNFNEGDHIYLFGFSRGAYTVRALAAFISHCGVLKSIKKSDTKLSNVEKLDDESLNKEIKRLAKFYEKRPGEDQSIQKSFNFNKTTIKFIGVWDTVSAVGMPFEKLKSKTEKLIFNFNFESSVLPERVDKACHALAIDDQRKTFHPKLWEDDNRVEQVWFSGMHSNVGGGYPKQGMSYVSLSWMISKLEEEEKEGTDGLLFIKNSVEEFIAKANPLGKMYDSRSGLAAYYRFEPRFFKKMKEEGLTNVKLHPSVIERIQHQTADYNPVNFVLAHNQELVIVDIPKKKKVNAQTLETVDAPEEEKGNALDDERENSEKCGEEIYNDLEEKNVEHLSSKQEALHLAFVQFSLLLFIALLSGYIALDTDGSPSETTESIKKYALIFSGVYVVIMLITFKLTKNMTKRWLCFITSILPFVIMFLPEYLPTLFPDHTLELLLGVVPLNDGWIEKILGAVPSIDGWIEKILGAVSCIVGIFLPDFLMNPIDYFIGNNTAIISIAILFFGGAHVHTNEIIEKSEENSFRCLEKSTKVVRGDVYHPK